MTTLYQKIGRRYHVWGDTEDRELDADVMKVGQSRLTVCLGPRARRYVYEVSPDAAGFIAAAQVAADAMAKAMRERAKARPHLGGVTYTEEQLRLIEKFRDDMAATGALAPTYWTIASADEIAQAGVKAVKQLME
jgi:hypothetical protein